MKDRSLETRKEGHKSKGVGIQGMEYKMQWENGRTRRRNEGHKKEKMMVKKRDQREGRIPHKEQ